MTAIRKLNKLVFTIGKRYSTFDPFVWADKLNLEIFWKELGKKPLAKTNYFFDEPLIMMSNNIRYSNQRYFALAHEIGHVLEHKGLAAYYVANKVNKHKTEFEADKFAMAVVTNLYIEESGHLPNTYQDLRYKYGSPNIGD
ncbi:ImmA/IrrE family metallo-endopeptidase [Companilactobacillus nantensis]|uniref:IrrE N-terminal-like domain-containing protein n=1 Tax=Companilactobacillus nantensis DSM 16982 TaxID=1423774 RepID=A0A0R1WHH1_9LACO|nr:ImmA/IrrE family metallo-endopeptidase [Companilactobacillus nantensis]KRM17296.1 hypothetical protein FD31_GL000375 [Companilactobacillus nantensis DSM 16982]GEO63972.1 hypothetical protein LNA01_11550 [Companilactobacillus nantensis]